LKIFSAFRDPEADAARCERDGNCDGVRRTLCSAHRTGLAMDIWVGSAPGGDPASTAAFNRLYQSRTPAYRWMVRNAGRFGFVNYSYEPWHWEWAGERI
jgi:LAS superfamily LD-carboxypeptidase LdcB